MVSKIVFFLQLPAHTCPEIVVDRSQLQYAAHRLESFSRFEKTLIDLCNVHEEEARRRRHDGKRKRDQETLEASRDKRPQEYNVASAQTNIAIEMKALQVSKDAEVAVSKLSTEHERLLVDCKESERIAFDANVEYVPSPELLTSLASKEKEAKSMQLSVVSMELSTSCSCEFFAQTHTELLAAMATCTETQVLLDQEKATMRDLLQREEKNGMQACAADMVRIIEKRDAAALSVTRLEKEDEKAAAHSKRQQMCLREACLIKTRFDNQVMAIRQTMASAKDECDGVHARLVATNQIAVENSRQDCSIAATHETKSIKLHAKLFAALDESTLQHMLRFTYDTETTNTTLEDLRRQVVQVRAAAIKKGWQTNDLGAMQAREQLLRDEVSQAEQEELVRRNMAYQKWGLRAGLHLTSNDTIPLDESHCQFNQQDKIAIAACTVIQLLPVGVQTHKPTRIRIRTYITYTQSCYCHTNPRLQLIQ